MWNIIEKLAWLAEQELSDKIKKSDELKDILEKRLQAARILEEESVDFAKHQNELTEQNDNLRRDVSRLREKLRAISNGTVELSNSTVVSAPGHDSSASSHSFASSLQSIPSNDAKKRNVIVLQTPHYESLEMTNDLVLTEKSSTSGTK